MKKILMILTAAAIMASATTIFAADAVYTDTNTTDSTLTVGTAPNTLVFKLSKNVLMAYNVFADSTGYAISAYHNKGTKTFGSSSGDSKIFENSATKVDPPAAPQGTASAAFTSADGWSAL